MKAPTKPLKPLSADDIQVWAAVAATVKPLTPQKKKYPMQEANCQVPSLTLENQTSPDIPPLLVKTTPAHSETAKPLQRLDRSENRTLKKETFGSRQVLDLHGLSAEQGKQALQRFVQEAFDAGLRSILVITGKGKGILRREVPHWLETPPLRRQVSRFGEAHIVHGGEGALYIKLRKRKTP
jgi:DNA-nicking Smr family endonuclease